MPEPHIAAISSELALTPNQVEATINLLQDGATIPFIARYRKEATGSLDEVEVTRIRDRLKQMQELEARKATILKSLEKHNHLTEELKSQVLSAGSASELEDIYLPYRPKRRTRAMKAKEMGLEPLALAIWQQNGIDVELEASSYVNPDLGVNTIEDALKGAQDIHAEMVSEDKDARDKLRRLYSTTGRFISKVSAGKEKEGAKYQDYFDWEESLAAMPSHRILAMRRGEKEDILNLSILADNTQALNILEDLFVHGEGPDSVQVQQAVRDAFKRLLAPAMETEARLEAKDRADTEAIKVFADNLRHLLMAPPLGSKRVMGIDPGFRTGCKAVCLNRQGKLVEYDTIFPHQGPKALRDAQKSIVQLCKRHAIEAIAVGNGTAGRETEAFLNGIDGIKGIVIIMVDESGASVYSASAAAREEFPDLDLTVRGAVSIGRRLMDPLAELVKIEPKSIGVGQYQHDVDQAALRQSLDDVVISCVNAVGVDVNHASAQLLAYISGLGPQLAKNIVAYRNDNGPFRKRSDLKKIPRLGPKAFEQCAGFLRIMNGDNPLDSSAVHPESYHIVDAISKHMDCSVSDLMKNAAIRNAINPSDFITDQVGIPTIKDIISELAKPGRDPRKAFVPFAFAEGVNDIKDLKAGMILPGIVTNVTAFGAFVDVGVHRDGLVHISQLANRYVKNPSEIVNVQQKVTVKVISVDLERGRISLSMKTGAEKNSPEKPRAKQRTKAAPKAKPVKNKTMPFNNPFAEAFKNNQ